MRSPITGTGWDRTAGLAAPSLLFRIVSAAGNDGAVAVAGFGVEREAPARETIAALTERLATSSLRVGLALMAASAAADTTFAILAGADSALVLDGAVIALVALAGVLRPARAANLLRPRGRIVLVAGVFVGLGALQPGIQTHYADTAMTIAWLAAIVASPRWVLASVAVCVTGAIGDQAAAGHSLDWMLYGAGGSRGRSGLYATLDRPSWRGRGRWVSSPTRCRAGLYDERE